MDSQLFGGLGGLAGAATVVEMIVVGNIASVMQAQRSRRYLNTVGINRAVLVFDAEGTELEGKSE